MKELFIWVVSQENVHLNVWAEQRLIKACASVCCNLGLSKASTEQQERHSGFSGWSQFWICGQNQLSWVLIATSFSKISPMRSRDPTAQRLQRHRFSAAVSGPKYSSFSFHHLVLSKAIPIPKLFQIPLTAWSCFPLLIKLCFWVPFVFKNTHKI